MNIAGIEIGSQPFTIAECGINHNGSISKALEMITVAKIAGCTAVKYQTFHADGVVADKSQTYTYKTRGVTGSKLFAEVTEPRIDIFRRCELPDSAWPILKAECDRQGIVFMSTPQNPQDLDLLLKVGIPAIKIGSDDLVNLPMLRYCSRDDVGLPIILSCGMSDYDDVLTALEEVGWLGHARDTALLVCTSQYPTPMQEANLSRITSLIERFKYLPVGLSDHTIGTTAAITAVGLGACVFEKHFTLDHNLPGPDHHWSANPAELRHWVNAIHEAWTMLGSGRIEPSEREREAKVRYQRTQTA